MSLWTVILIGVGVSADAFAAALVLGVRMKAVRYRQVLTVAGVFAAFQIAMPLLGWLLASWFATYLAPVDHWIAFALLAVIGINMIREAFVPSTESHGSLRDELAIGRLLLLGLATSIDALAVGVSLTVMDAPMVEAVVVFGVTTFVFSAVALPLGQRAGLAFRRPAEAIGGLVLLVIGARILVEHLTAG